MKTKGYARILAKRNMGGVAFLTVRFQEGQIQLIITKKQLPNFKELAAVPIGSILYIEGYHGVSNSGTASITVEIAHVEAVCELEIPDKHNGLNSRKQYNNRALGLIADNDSFGLFKAISDLSQRVRKVLSNHNYSEFNTGILQGKFEGGLANSFSTVCNANGREYYLSLTSEMKLKKLIAGGFDRVYEITESFRNEGVNTTHYPEFSILEAYAAGNNLHPLSLLVQDLLAELRVVAGAHPGVDPLEEKFGWVNEEITFAEALSREGFHSEDALAELQETNPDQFPSGMPSFTLVYKALTKVIAPKLYYPTLVTNLPIGFNPFCKVESGNCLQSVLMAKGMHIATLSVDENNREVVTASLQNQHEETGVSINSSYLELLSLGLPPIVGIGLGMTRLAMLLLPEGKQNVRDVIPFPFI